MMETVRAVDPLIPELEQEAQTTRVFLEAVPGDKLEWRPHPKSMTLGQLALHVASVCDVASGFTEIDGIDLDAVDFTPAHAESKDAILKTFEQSLEAARTRLAKLDNETALQSWKATRGGETVFSVPKIGLIRGLLLNHLYHHRGQMSVYLRLLDVPVPVAYGRTADMNPLG